MSMKIEAGGREYYVRALFDNDDTWYVEGFARLNAVDIIDGSARFKLSFLQHENWFATAKNLEQALAGLRSNILQFDLDFDNCIAVDDQL